MFLQAVVVFVGVVALVCMLWEPHLEGRNAHATLFEVYFKDPFLAFAYLGSSAFFWALYQAFKVLGSIGQNEAFSQATVMRLRTIRRCAFIILGFVAAGEIFIVFGTSDDRAGGVVIGLFIAFGSGVAAAAAAVLEGVVQGAVAKEVA